MKKPNQVFIVSNPSSTTNKSSFSSLNKFINVVSVLDKRINIITSEGLECDKDVNLFLIRFKKSKNSFIHLFEKISFSIKTFFICLKRFKKNDICFFWIADSMLLSFLAAKIKKANIYYFIYGNPLKIPEEKNNKTYKRIVYMGKRSNYICAEGNGVFDEWNNIFKQERKVIHLYSPMINNKQIENDKIKFGVLSRLSNGKHIIEIIEAFNEMLKIKKNMQLEIIGDGPLKKIIEQKINSLGISDNVKLIGWVDSANIYNYCKNWKYSILISDTEGLPNSLLETMGQGVPNIVTSVGAVKDIVNENNGVIVNSIDIISIYYALEKSLNIDENKYLAMSNNAFNTIKQKYSLAYAQNTFLIALEDNK